MSTTTKTRRHNARVAEPRKKEEPSILGRAMLCDLRISVWGAGKHDRDVTEEVNTRHLANPQAGRYQKNLFGKRVPSHQAIVAAAANARKLHYEMTLPWSDSGPRLLASAMYLEHSRQMDEASLVLFRCVDAFIADFPRLKEEAKHELNDMYREEDYPQLEELRNKFAFTLDYFPIPSASDFRVTLPGDELKRISEEMEERIAEATRAAMTEAWKRLGDAVSVLKSRLNDGKYLRSRMVERIQEVGEALGRLNVTGDLHLEQMRKEALRDLGSLNVAGLRKDSKARAEAEKKANDILAKMSDFYTPIL